MEYNKMFERFLEESNPRKSYAMLELFILKILEQYLKSQDKKLLTNYVLVSTNSVNEFDAYAPDGFDSFEGATIFEIKLYRNRNSLFKLFKDKSMDRLINKFFNSPLNIKNIIFIVPLELSLKDKSNLLNMIAEKSNNSNIYIWGIKDLQVIFDKYPSVVFQTYENISELLLNTTISDSFKKNSADWLLTRENHIEKLRSKFYDDDLVLFLGAGVSMGAMIPTWDSLVSALLVSLISNKLLEYKVNLSEKEKNTIVGFLKEHNGSSPLLLARYIRSGLQDVFIDILTEILYKNCTNTSKTLQEISQLCLPVRNGVGIQGVITYNFDDLLEFNFKNYRIKHKSIYKEADVPSHNELGIYHVHGFLPRNPNEYDNVSKGLLVFSEEGYHSLMLDPYNWSNLIQLNYLKENTCLMIGLSVTDPNLRRLLDIAIRKQEDVLCRHYVILKRESFLEKAQKLSQQDIKLDSINKFDVVNQDLQEEYYKELGLNVIWVESYEEIPDILKKIKE